jgi:hypothetical protein
MVLDPLTEVRIGVLVPIGIGRSQFVVDILRHSKRRKSQKDTNNPQGHSSTEQGNQAAEFHRQNHRMYKDGARDPILRKLPNPAENKSFLRALSRGMDFSPAFR